MSTGIRKISSKYWGHFGQIAMEMGFIDSTQLDEALRIQSTEEDAPHGPRMLANICFDNGWMSSAQIDQVLNAVLKQSRLEEGALKDTMPSQDD